MKHRPPPSHRSTFAGPEWLGPPQVAAALHLSLSRVYVRLWKRQIPATQDRTYHWHVHRDDLERIKGMDWYQKSIARRS